ncbi:hypothetical protein K505DRAFT_398840 [Melanomma pulvis-pyrius CBS 109.77]|uniref:Uncharacterized protein n=1 Tax=Melanomma pulvis-pyrius CBS 109.77 TaxID=1314802 RepID=A0A6A6WQZ2_9PLEO|nr:hypothetical protein K505DRAFT_398840 [Melanomma pulvis-pyrius CBS 109.77]
MSHSFLPPMTEQELLALHERAQRNLEFKLLKVPMRVLVKRPTIQDIYKETQYTYLQDVPEAYQLPFFFSNYQDILESKFTARKVHQRDEITKAIWFYQLDNRHSFSHHHMQIRLNILLMIIVAAAPRPFLYCDPASHAWREDFLMAWESSVERQQDPSFFEERFVTHWRRSEWEFVFFTKHQLDKIRVYLRKTMCAGIPKLPFEIPDYRLRGYELGYDQHCKNGLGWAFQWLMHWYNKDRLHEEVEAAEALRHTAKGVDEMDVDMDADMDVDEDVPLSRELFEKPIVRALLEDVVDDGTIVADEDEARYKPWMDWKVAMNLLTGKPVGEVGNVADMLSHLTFVELFCLPCMTRGFEVDSVMDMDPGGVMKEYGFDLARVNWNHPLVSGVLVDIDHGSNSTSSIPEELDMGWMGVDDAIALLEDECGEAVDAMTQLFGNMSMGGAGAMEE